MNLSPTERERLAYAAGDLETARILGKLIDAEKRVDTLEFKVEKLQEELRLADER